MDLLLEDRASAGRQLAAGLAKYTARPNVLVLAIAPRGVPVAAQVAQSLRAPLDVIAVRKLELPHACAGPIGALATGGARTLDLGTF